MNKYILTFLLVIVIFLQIGAVSADITVINASNVGGITSQPISENSPRIVVEYADSISNLSLINVSTGLVNNLAEILPRIVVEYADSISNPDLYVIPKNLEDATSKVSPRIVVEYADSIKTKALIPMSACNDGIKNGDETDVDCGGSCPLCEDGKNCLEKADCLSDYCNWEKICAIAQPIITSPLEIIPQKDIYYVGDTINAEFTIKNRRDEPITFDVLTVGGRLNGWCPDGVCPDFTFRDVVLNPSESYNYEGNLTLTQPGSYHFFVTYYTENPTPEEKELLDENNWNTFMGLEDGLTHEDRIENIVVVTEEEVSELRDTIKRRLNQKIYYPPYLLDPDSFTNAVASIWAEFTSWATQSHLTDKYDELHQAGIDFDGLRFKSLKNALNFLDRNDIANAEEYLKKSYKYEKLSFMSFTAAAEVYAGNLEAGEILAEGIKNGCEAAVKCGLHLTNPQAAKVADYAYIFVDYAINTLLGEEEAFKQAMVELFVTVIFNEVVFDDLDGRTLADYTKNKVGKLTFPMLQDAFKKEELQFILSKALKEAGIEIEKQIAEEVIHSVTEGLEKGVDLDSMKAKSPVEVRVYNLQRKATGLLNGKVKHEISRSVYNNGTVEIYFSNESYIYWVEGTDDGTYGLDITSIENGTTNSFGISNVPTENNTVHNYIINWSSYPQDGIVNIKIDSDGDGVFEQNVTIRSPVANFSYLPINPFLNEMITFDASLSFDSDGSIMSYEWDFGDGTNGTGAIISHSYSSPKAFTVTLRVEDNDGVISSIEKRLLVKTMVNLTFTEGWNLISIPLELTNISINYTFNQINPIIFSYKNNSWFVPDYINNKLGYWVKLNESYNITVIGTEIKNKNIKLDEGWNLIGYPSLEERNVSKVFEDVNITSVFAYNGSWVSYVPNRTLNSLKEVRPSYGYWVYSNEDDLTLIIE